MKTLGIITGIAMFLLRKNKPGLFIGWASCCVFLVLLCFDKWVSLQQDRLIVFNTGKANHIERIEGDHFSVFDTDTTIVRKIKYAVTPAHIHWHAWKEKPCAPSELFLVHGKTVLVLNHELSGTSKFPVDYLVINYTGKPYLRELAEVYAPKVIVIGNNYSRRQQDDWKNAGKIQGVTIHAIAGDGAFCIE